MKAVQLLRWKATKFPLRSDKIYETSALKNTHLQTHRNKVPCIHEPQDRNLEIKKWPRFRVKVSSDIIWLYEPALSQEKIIKLPTGLLIVFTLCLSHFLFVLASLPIILSSVPSHI